jgi:hypothetical protein
MARRPVSDIGIGMAGLILCGSALIQPLSRTQSRQMFL